MDSVNKSNKVGGWNAAIFIIFVEMAERFAFYGVAGNLVTYFTNVFHEPIATAAKNVNTWVGVSYLFPLLGAFIADSYLGRCKTILFSSIIYFTGMVLLTLSASVIPLERRKLVFFIALYILSVGEGGHKPCVQTFAADQFDDDLPEEKKAKSSFFNWWFLGIVTGASAAILAVIYIQDNVGWAAGFGLLSVALVVAFGLFLLGIKKYRKQGPLGSTLTMVAQVFVAAAKKRRVNETHDGRVIYYGDEMGGVAMAGQTKVRTLAPTNQFSFLNKAMIIDTIDASSNMRNPWRLCSVNQVEEVKLVLRLIPIWFSCLFFNVIQSQTNTFFVKQGSTMIRSVGSNFQLPPASLQSLVGLTVLIFIPIYDQILVPIARRYTGKPSGITILQRIGIGLFLTILSMVVSALVEGKRVEIARYHNLLDNPKGIVPMRVWWLFPQYMICGLSDTFTLVGLQELFYDQMPESMRSLGAAAYVSLIGVGGFICNATISIVEAISRGKWLGDNLNCAHLNYFYWLLAGLATLNLCIYVLIANQYAYKKIKIEGDHEGDEMKEMSLS
ncbi:protein NRT1/ PTR FAMILY 5.4-like [Quillaja saponaria]|uniref:Protein NRT1/ PTR FAMILY 5.4-like n=1 Tax=Quillaja saponaria TaxID=32244 RepID=A0AAD7PBF9_QUISA|nr:protein NRT1/ PTR FAMILY 5.4-like [Quillaja saponaria]